MIEEQDERRGKRVEKKPRRPAKGGKEEETKSDQIRLSCGSSPISEGGWGRSLRALIGRGAGYQSMGFLGLFPGCLEG